MSEIEGTVAVLANDPEFQRKVAEQMQLGAGAQIIGRVIGDIFRGIAATRRGEPVAPVAEEGMRAAQEFFARVLQHNEEPSDEEVEAMVRSWSA